ncbi:MAG: DUF4139 domain-containing protein [Planctomycetes bacterium]|nr:DUF4139 domain-containing protein [Planctomycetota bacterium]
MRWLFPLLILSVFTLAGPLNAKEELVTLPKRDTVQLTIYNSVDLTLVRETRDLTFKKGNNRLQFSWANTLIDPTSVEFKALSNADKLEVLDTSYPAESNQMLIWTVSADEDTTAKVEISYFTSGISWNAEYHGMLSSDESSMHLTAYVSVTNNSGEEYENAKVRLIVGSIHLVEEIAALAGGQRMERMKAAYSKMRAADAAPNKKREIVKEGLSEYYIYSIEGAETIPNGWSKRLESFVQDGVALRTVYTWDPSKYGNALAKLLVFKNDEAHKLGREPLPAGIVRLFRDAGSNRLSFVGQVYTDYIPKNDEVKVNAGFDPEVQLKMKRTSFKKDNLTFRWSGNRQYIVGWDTVEDFEIEIKNFRKRAVDFEVNVVMNGDFDFDSKTKSTKIDFRTQRFTLTMEAGGSTKVTYNVRTRYGQNIKNK